MMVDIRSLTPQYSDDRYGIGVDLIREQKTL